jgi:DNA-binding response OmpR family regulator
VLIVDRSTEIREVLRIALARRGATTIEARRPSEAVRLAESARLDLIVLDAESDPTADGSATADLQAAAGRNDTPIVILGTLAPSRSGNSPGEFIAKPYHYGPLLRKIEALLAAA